MKFTKKQIKERYPFNDLSDKAIDVLSRLEVGKKYTFDQLNCHYQTWFGIMCKSLLTRHQKNMLPSHKYDEFSLSKIFIKYMSQGIIYSGPIKIKMEQLKNI